MCGLAGIPDVQMVLKTEEQKLSMYLLDHGRVWKTSISALMTMQSVRRLWDLAMENSEGTDCRTFWPASEPVRSGSSSLDRAGRPEQTNKPEKNYRAQHCYALCCINMAASEATAGWMKRGWSGFWRNTINNLRCGVTPPLWRRLKRSSLKSIFRWRWRRWKRWNTFGIQNKIMKHRSILASQ